MLYANFQLSLTAEWPDDDDFPPSAPPSRKHSTPCTTQQWLEQHGLTSKAAISVCVVGWTVASFLSVMESKLCGVHKNFSNLSY